MVSSLLRHGLTLVGGILVSRGYFDPAQLEVLIGATLSVFGVVWAVYSKKK